MNFFTKLLNLWIRKKILKFIKKIHNNSKFMKIHIKIPNIWNFHNIIKFVENTKFIKIYEISKKGQKLKIYQKLSKMPKTV